MKETRDLTFAEVLFNLNSLLFIKTTLKRYIANPNFYFDIIDNQESINNIPKAIELIKKYYPKYKLLFHKNRVMEHLGLIFFQRVPNPLNLTYTQALIDIAPTIDITNTIFNSYTWETFDSKDIYSRYHLTHTYELIEFFIKNGVCADYFLGLARSVVFFTEDNYSDGALKIFTEKMNFILTHCRDVAGLPDLAKYIFMGAMGFEDIETMKLCFSFNPYFNEEDNQKIREHGCSRKVIDIYLDYVRNQAEY